MRWSRWRQTPLGLRIPVPLLHPHWLWGMGLLLCARSSSTQHPGLSCRRRALLQLFTVTSHAAGGQAIFQASNQSSNLITLEKRIFHRTGWARRKGRALEHRKDGAFWSGPGHADHSLSPHLVGSWEFWVFSLLNKKGCHHPFILHLTKFPPRGHSLGFAREELS